MVCYKKIVLLKDKLNMLLGKYGETMKGSQKQ